VLPSEGNHFLPCCLRRIGKEITVAVRNAILGTVWRNGPGVPLAWIDKFTGSKRDVSTNDALREIARAKRWALDGESPFAGVVPEALAPIAQLLAGSVDDPGKSMSLELVSRLEKALPDLTGQIRADALRVVAINRDGAVALSSWRELLATEFADAGDVVAAGEVAVLLKEGTVFRSMFQNAIQRFPEKCGRLNYRFGMGLRKLGADGEALPYFRAAQANSTSLNSPVGESEVFVRCRR